MKNFKHHMIFSIASWLVLTLVVSFYCYLHNIFTGSWTNPWLFSLQWSAKTWAVWIVLSPVLYSLVDLRAIQTGEHQPYFKKWGLYSLGFIVSAITLKLLIDWISGEPFMGNAYYYLSTEPMVYLFIMFAAHLYKFQTEKHMLYEAKVEEKCEDLILVNKGNAQVKIPRYKIKWIQASGNYVEIHDEGNQYLLRSTLAQMDRQLDSEQFIRIHRSYVVNKKHVQRVTQSNGKSTIILNSGQKLPLSRSYKQQFEQLIPVI